MNKKNTIIKTLLVAIGFCFSLLDSAHAFVLITGGGHGHGQRPTGEAVVWPSRSVDVYINPDMRIYGGSIDPKITEQKWIDAVIDGVKAWDSCEADLKINIKFGPYVYDTNDRIVSISYDNRTTAQGNLIAGTSSLFTYGGSWNGNFEFNDCDIVINGEYQYPYAVNGDEDSIDLVGLIAHTMGYCLGLGASNSPGSFTSSNSIVTASTMNDAFFFGETYKRDINQDDRDGLQCLYPYGKSLRQGERCGSYFGTNGGAALSGVVSGGPSREDIPKCGDKTLAATVTPADVNGSGCITKAFAAGTHKGPSDGFSIKSFLNSWLIELFLIGLAYALYRTLRRRSLQKSMKVLGFMIVLFGLGATTAKANVVVDLGADYRFSNPKLMNLFADLNEGYFHGTSKDGSFTKSIEIVPKVFFYKRGPFYLGVFGRYLLPQTITQKGEGLADGVKVTKTTEFSSISAGPAARVYLFRLAMFQMAIEAGLGIGMATLNQTIEATTTNSLEASAYSIEANGTLWFGMKLLPMMTLNVGAGYSRYNTNAFATKSASGTLYTGISEGKRIQVVDGTTSTDLRAQRSGYVAQAALSFMF